MVALDYDRILGVKPNCSLEEVRRRYRLLARRHHPDHNPDDPEAAARFRLIAAAFEAIQAARAEAKAKGRSVVMWTVLGFFFSWIPLLIVAIMPRKQ